jgi:hypothetical protein
MLNPYAILAGLALLIAVAFGGAHVGQKLERTAWQAKEIATAAAVQSDLIAEHDKYVRLQKFNEAAARKATADHEQAITALTAQYAAARAAIRAAGGLRVSRAICADPHTTTTEAPGTSGPDDASAGTVALPEIVEVRLLAIAKEADELAERLRALQGWIVANGLYGDPPKP